MQPPPPPPPARPSFFSSLFGEQKSPPGKDPSTKFTLANLSSLYSQLSRVVVVNERNQSQIVESLRNIAEIIIWGDQQHDPAIFECFLENNMLAIFWRFLEQEDTPSSVKQQLLQTLSLLIQNIDAGPSVYFILSNNHINDLIRHQGFDLTNEELIANYVSLLKAIALRLDKDTVQFFISEEPEPTAAPAGDDEASSTVHEQIPPRTVTRFALYEEALKLWSHEDRMVRTAVRTIVLSICRVDDAAVRAFISRSPLLPRQLNASLRSDCAALTKAIAAVSMGSRTAAPAAAPAAAPVPSGPSGLCATIVPPTSSELSSMEGQLQHLLDELYFVHDVLDAAATNVKPLCARLRAALFSQFVMPVIVQPLASVSSERVGSEAVAHEMQQTLPRLVALLVLSHCLSVFGHPPLLMSILTLLLHPGLALADVKFSKFELLPPSDALEHARQSVESSFDGGDSSGGSNADGIVMPIAEGGPERNALRAAVLGALCSTDERTCFFACCALLSALRCTAPSSTGGGKPAALTGHAELLKQAKLLPLRQLRSESLLAQLISSKTKPKLSGSGLTADGAAEYCEPAVQALLELLLRAAKQPILPEEDLMSTAVESKVDASADPSAAAPSARSGAMRLVTVQSAVELLLELTHDSSARPNLSESHARLLETAQACAARNLRRALKGRFAASLGNLVEYECRQLPLPLTASFKLGQLLSDCSLLLPAERLAQAKAVPLARRAPRDELEATRAAIQTFLLTRHARNLLLRYPEDLRTLGKPAGWAGAAPPIGGRLELPGLTCQLLPCSLLVHMRQPERCQLLVFTTAKDIDGKLVVAPPAPSAASASEGPKLEAPGGATEAPLSAAHHARNFLLLVRPSPGVALGVDVLLALPLTALTLSVPTGGTKLVCRVPRHHQPPTVSPEHPIQLEFDDLWRCSAAKAQIEAACTSARAEQHDALVALLAVQPLGLPSVRAVC